MSDSGNANCNCDPACSLQQWMESCLAGRDPTCPLCTRSISCPAHDVHRLHFQSAGSVSTDSQVSPSRILQTAVEDLKHVNSSSSFCEWKSKLDDAVTIVYEQLKELQFQAAVILQRAEKAEAATVVARSEPAQCIQDPMSFQEELMRFSLELEKLQAEIGAMEKRVEAFYEQARRDSFFGFFGFFLKIVRIAIL